MSAAEEHGLADVLLGAIEHATAELTEDEIIASDPVAWVKWAKPMIEHKQYGQVVFEPWDYQEQIMRLRAAGQSFVIEKSRQTGVSTAVIMADVHALLYADACFSHIIAQKEEVAKERLLQIAKLALDTCELTDEQQRTVKIRGGHVGFNRNYIRCHSGDKDATRSYGGNRILLEEVAYMEDGEGIWKSGCPMIDDHSGHIAVVSNYNGDGAFFCHLVDDHEALELELITIDWRRHPERDEAWKLRSLKKFEGSEDEWAEEHELQRLTSGEMVMDIGLIMQLAQQHEASCFRPQVHPIKGHAYALGSDVSGGGRARSVNVAIDLTTEPPHLAVMEGAAKLSHPDRVAFIEAFGRRFGGEHWVDGNGPGAAVVEEMKPTPQVMQIVGGSVMHERWRRDEVSRLRVLMVPRDRLLALGARKLESASVVVPRWHRRAIMALRSARWGRKAGTSYTDELDALLMAAWPVPELHIRPARGRGPVLGLPSSRTLLNILGRRF